MEVEELCLVPPHVEDVVTVVRGDVDSVAPGGRELRAVDHHRHLSPHHHEHHGVVSRVGEPLAGLARDPDEGGHVTWGAETLAVRDTSSLRVSRRPPCTGRCWGPG